MGRLRHGKYTAKFPHLRQGQSWGVATGPGISRSNLADGWWVRRAAFGRGSLLVGGGAAEQVGPWCVAQERGAGGFGAQGQ
jgi:hypothetical protein